MGTDLAGRGRMLSRAPVLLLRGAGLAALLILASCVKVTGDMFATSMPAAPLERVELNACIASAARGFDRGVILTGKGTAYEIGLFQGGRIPGTLQQTPIREVVLHDATTGTDVSFSANDCQVLEGEVVPDRTAWSRKQINGTQALAGTLQLQCEREGFALWGAVRFERCSL
jgi:hypothetical protein